MKVYQELIVDYIDYRGLEAELLEWKEKYAYLAKKSKDLRPNSCRNTWALTREDAISLKMNRLRRVESVS